MVTIKHVTTIVVCALAVGCSSAKKLNPSNDVWNLYDVRHPVPSSSAVPVSRATNPYYQTAPQGQVIYYDNDSVYIPPSGGGFDNRGVCGTEVGVGCE